jgi:hypothetical protein
MKKKREEWSRPRSLSLPFIGLRIPILGGLYLGGGKILLVSMSTVAIGFLLGVVLLISKGDQELVWPAAGAQYTAPSLIGARVVDRETPSEISQTLQINLPGGIRINRIHLKNVSLGKTGLATAVQISGTSTAYILIDDLIIRNSSFPTMDFANSEFFSIIATTSVEAAGHTFAMTASSTIADITIGSARGTITYDAENMVVDRIIITALLGATSDVIIDELILDGVNASVGAFDLDWVKAGTVTLENLKVGDDGDINSADLVMNSTVWFNSVVDGVVEKPINIK